MRYMTRFFTKLMNRYLPDAFVIAIILTMVTIALAVTLQGANLIEVTYFWGSGFWDLLEFAMQMAIVLLTGYVLAKAPIVDRVINAIISPIKKPSTAIVIATLVGGIGSLINWGFGLVAGGIVAQKLAIRVKGVHYPLIIAAAFSGFCLYPLGISGPVALTLSTDGHFIEEITGVIPLTETVFFNANATDDPGYFSYTSFIKRSITSKRATNYTNPSKYRTGSVNVESASVIEQDPTPANRLSNSKVPGVLIGVLGLMFIIIYFSQGETLNLNIINFIMLFLGIMLIGSPAIYLRIAGDGIRTVTGIVLQYPFYAGIMAILVGTGLVTTFSNWLISFASEQTLPLFTLISAYFINILAPSGGGQWIVQGPVMMQAALDLGAAFPPTAMAVALGDSWNTIIQPFWILPVLAIAKLHLRDVMGYLVTIMFWVGIVFVSTFLLWGFLGS
ncbi:LOW QUALITY PROTEIN: short chain fatty acids transporter [Geomicrobium sp. JCM 19055]|nr:LOW QUALITY PROTEIN: short chain fatty acids transporter [Geomicrobium sp. JCM 19055]